MDIQQFFAGNLLWVAGGCTLLALLIFGGLKVKQALDQWQAERAAKRRIRKENIARGGIPAAIGETMKDLLGLATNKAVLVALTGIIVAGLMYGGQALAVIADKREAIVAQSTRNLAMDAAEDIRKIHWARCQAAIKNTAYTSLEGATVEIDPTTGLPYNAPTAPNAYIPKACYLFEKEIANAMHGGNQ